MSSSIPPSAFSRQDRSQFYVLHEVKAQSQEPPGLESHMDPRPEYERLLYEATGELKAYRGIGKLRDQVAVVTGGDSGIGRSISVLFAHEGARVAILCRPEDKEDAMETQGLVWAAHAHSPHACHCPTKESVCLVVFVDIGDEDQCKQALEMVTVEMQTNRIDVLVNNAAEQRVVERIEELQASEVERVFRTNVLGMIWMCKHALKWMPEGARVINTTSVVAYKGSEVLLDYSATKGAIVSFTRSLALQLAPRHIRVNAVAPGPIWTPLIPSSFKGERAHHWSKEESQKTALHRLGQPVECATCFVFLASAESSYMTGQVLHPNGGVVVNG